MEGKVALVTGASRGIGRQIVSDLIRVSKVSKVYALCLLEKELSQLSADFPDQIVTHVIDLTGWKETRELIQSIPDSIDLLVNNAGIVEIDPIGGISEGSFDRIFDVNVKAVLNVSQVVSRKMISSGTSGAIVNISSQASHTALGGHTVYSASKAAVDAMTRAFALELGPHGIRVNSVQPTATMTCLGRKVWSDESRAKPLLDRIPLRRFAEVSDISRVVLFLLDNEVASMITGIHLPIDGGFSIA